MILIGSKAIKYYYPDFKREPKDIDYIVGKPMKREAGIEYLINPILYELNCTILSPDLLYTLKVSHIFWDISWNKHIYDIQFLQSKGCKLVYSMFYKLYEYWNTFHSKNKRSDLKMTSKDFFNNALKCPYDHDTLHTYLTDVPTFTKILKDGADVEVCETKFNTLSYGEKLSLVREEVYVMAFERMAGRDYRISYSWMLKKFIISHAPIWEALFIIENYTILSRPHINYVKQINSKIYEHQTNQRDPIES